MYTYLAPPISKSREEEGEFGVWSRKRENFSHYHSRPIYQIMERERERDVDVCSRKCV